jgi:peptidoglycan/xylan/chitin deacetylase (PgdA/CDA1 family)
MKKYKIIILFFLFCLNIFFIYPELKFDVIALDRDNEFLFNSIEILGGKEYNKTLFYGSLRDNDLSYKAVTFYPENLYYSKDDKVLYIYNRLGLYSYDLAKKSVDILETFPNYINDSEYIIYDLPEVSFSPNFQYVLGKVQTSNVKSSICLFDLKNNKSEEVIKNVEINPGEKIALWANDSNFFIYQKNSKIYYFSIQDYKKGKLLAEEWRKIGNIKLSNAEWTSDNYLIWIEDKIIYKADSNQFFTRSIYKKYLKQGNIIGTIPYKFNPDFDSLEISDEAKKVILIKDNNMIFYFSLMDDLKQNLYLRLNENERFEKCKIYNNGEAIIVINKLEKGDIKKGLVLIKKDDNGFKFERFTHEYFKNLIINDIFISDKNSYFTLNTSKGCYCFDFKTLQQLWKYEGQEIVQSLNINTNEWILGGKYITFLVNPDKNIFNPIFASSFNNAGFIDNKIGIVSNNKNYFITQDSVTLSESNSKDFRLYNNSKVNYSRIIVRDINKGFYKQSVYIKDLYTSKLLLITGDPKLKYNLYQPEIKIGPEYYSNPSPEKHEIALVFNCVKTAEGVFPILAKLKHFKIPTTFFINGMFMELNPKLTKEISNFDNIEIGNLFHYYINLTDNAFLIDKNFIRQGLGINEEKFYKITGKNFAPLWHSPMYSFNDTIIKYGEESGYKFVSYNLDSLDWIGVSGNDFTSGLYMSNSQLVERILKNVSPGQIIIFNTGVNDSTRSDWLFNDIDLLISELIRAGYSFTTVTDLMKRYRE